MTTIIGITGGIGSGKSTLSNHLKKTGHKVHESDQAVSKLYTKPTRAFLDFIKKCGLQEALKKKQINKTLIAEKIFDNKHLKKRFEKHIHKKIKKDRDKFIKKNLNKKNKAIFVDVPLLFENKLEPHFDFVVCIISKKTNRLKRVLNANKLSKEIFNKIVKQQATDIERKKRSDILIYNNKTKKDFILTAQKALASILK